MEKKYIGITLVFSCEKGKALEGRMRYFLMNLARLTDIKRTAEKAGHRCETTYKECNYLGINDIFEVTGPIKVGAIMGRATLWSYKNIASAKKLVRPSKQFSIYKCNESTVNKSYIAEMIYFLQAPGKYDLQRTLICDVLLKSQNKKRVVKDAIALGQSKKLLTKIRQVLLQYESDIPDGLVFIGLANIHLVPERVAVGNSFRAVRKEFNKISSILKLTMTNKELSAKIRSLKQNR